MRVGDDTLTVPKCGGVLVGPDQGKSFEAPPNSACFTRAGVK
jgi:hypothetical protein